MTTRKLTAKQEKFYRAYLETGNASEAYRQVYDTARMKPETVNKRASELLQHREIAGRLVANESKLRQAAEERYFVSKERIIRELALIGFSNMLDYIQPQDDGTAYVDLSRLDRDQAAAISEVTVESYTEGSGEERSVKRVKFKLSDKRAALVDLGKQLGMFPQRVEATGKDGGPIEFQSKAKQVRSEMARKLARLASGSQAA
jgi:phage terminase small subunit